MTKRYKRRKNGAKPTRVYASAALVVLVLLLGVVAAQLMESRMAVEVRNAGEQLTSHINEESTAQVFMNGQWHEKRNVETLLVMGIDNFGTVASSGSYNNTNQADFLVLFVHDVDSGENAAIHLNRDTMTDITVLGVTGEAAGTRRAQLALAYNYGRGENDSSRNTANAVSRLLYGVEVDHYITVTMTAVPILNDWVGGVAVEVLDDFTDIDNTLVLGEEITLKGEQALTYVRIRSGLDDSSNLNRMKRQRQYASQWIKAAQPYLNNGEAIKELVVQMSDCHYSDCTVDELIHFAEIMSADLNVAIHELAGESLKGEMYMEYYVDDNTVQQLVLELFYKPVS